MGKTLYHSELVKAGETDITITCNAPTPSKYSNKPPFMTLNWNGEDRLYNCENDGCGEDLSGRQGQTVRIIAEGRDQDAKITVLETLPNRPRDTRTSTQPPPRSAPVARPPAREQAPPREPAQRQSEPPRRMTKEDREAAEWEAFKKTSRRAKQMGVMMHLCLQQASNCAADTKGALSNEDVRQLAITMFIELKGRTELDALPIEVLSGPPKPAERQQPPPRQPDPPPREPDAWEQPQRAAPTWATGDDGVEDDIPF